MTVYRLCGQLVDSEIPISEYSVAVTEGVARPDLVVVRESDAPQREVPESAIRNRIVVDGEPVLSVAALTEGTLLRVHGYADFVVDAPGRAVRCAAVPGVAAETLGQIVVDRLLPHALAHRGVTTLHASAVAGSHGAIAFVGDPASGKSTLAGSLCPPLGFLCDDCAAIEDRAGRSFVHPSYPLARLRHDAATFLADATEQLATSPQRSHKWRLPRPAAELARPLLHAYSLVQDTSTQGPVVERLRPRDAIAEYARHLFRLDPTDRARLGREVEQLERLATTVPLSWLRYPPRLDQLEAVKECLLRDLAPPPPPS